MDHTDNILFKQQCYINGQWLNAQDEQTITVTNPANGEVLGSVPKLSGDEVNQAITAADNALPAWKNKTAKERLTIDFNLSFKKSVRYKNFENLVIIEVKQERFSRSSPVVKQLKLRQINPYSLSKYCIGMIEIYEGLKYNRFKEKLIKINNITA